ncbi:unnamed protein product [Prorocentrum cordatum]|uniref:Amino acid transporter n=1 Tax=Prorocentrum cordatum TaxID=2364126 RepID=A0ABN9VBK3_9DINO|nr:unnamed protein product [Polarella glacialis]
MPGRRRAAPGAALLACAALLRAAAGSAATGLAEAPCATALDGRAGDDGAALLARTLLLQTHLEQRTAVVVQHSSNASRNLEVQRLTDTQEAADTPVSDLDFRQTWKALVGTVSDADTRGSDLVDSRQMWKALVGTVPDGSKVRAAAKLSRGFRKDVLGYWSTNAQLLKLGLAAALVITVPALLLEQYGLLMVVYVASIVSIGLLTTVLQEPADDTPGEVNLAIEMATQTLGWVISTVLSAGLFAARWLFNKIHGGKGAQLPSGREAGAMVASGLIAAMTSMAIVLDGPSEHDGTTCGVVREAGILWMPVLWRYQFGVDLGFKRLNSIPGGAPLGDPLAIAPATISSTLWVFIIVLTTALNIVVGEAALKRGPNVDINAQNAVASGMCSVLMMGYMVIFHSSYSLASLPAVNGGLFTKLVVAMHVVTVFIQSRLLKYFDAISTMVARVLVGPSLIVCMRLISDHLVVDHGAAIASVVVSGGCLCWFWNGSLLVGGSALGCLEKGSERAPAGRLLQGASAADVHGVASSARLGHGELLPKESCNPTALECRLPLPPRAPVQDDCESDEDGEWWWQPEPPELAVRTVPAAEAAYVLMAHVEDQGKQPFSSLCICLGGGTKGFRLRHRSPQ